MLDVAIVGAGFAGLYMLHRARGMGFAARIFEAGGGVGGTWFWNRYPGARCDIESLEYSYSFSEELQREWQWTERYASQPEILRYLNFVADRLDLKRDIQFDTRVTAAAFDEETGRWEIFTGGGERISARFCVMATGCLSATKVPEVKGIDSFRGKLYHTGRWPHEPVSFAGQSVGVIGTGSSGIQLIPALAREAAHVYVFQRTPNFSVPAQNRPLAPETTEDWRTNGQEYRSRARHSMFGVLVETNPQPAMALSAEEREREYQKQWQRGGLGMIATFPDHFVDRNANETAAEFVRGKIRSIVRDRDVAEKLTPAGYPLGAKRLCVDTGYYDTFNRENVTLVDLRETPLEEITETGVRTTGREFRLDSIVFATGFDAITGALCGIEIRGRDGVLLKEKWAQGPRSYLGLMASGFPNLFTITGPGSPSVLSNMVVSIEQHVEWISGCLEYMRDRRLRTIEATPEAEDSWVRHVNEVAGMTLFPQANSWYVGANVPGKARIFMPYVGGVGNYRRKCEEVASNGYEGFAFGGAAAVAS